MCDELSFIPPVCLRGQSAHSLSGAGPRHQAAALQLQPSSSAAALLQQLLDGQRLDDRLTQAQVGGVRTGLAAQLKPQVHTGGLLALLSDGGH